MMVRNLFIILVLILFCSCSTPIKKQHVVKSKDYKNYITLKEEPERKTIPQKIADVFKKKEPEVDKSPPSQPKAKNTKSKIPRRRIRQTNTNDVSTAGGDLMPMSPRPAEPPVKSKHNYFLYFIYLQAFIIALLSGYVYFKLRSPKIKKDTDKSERELNL